MKVRGDNAPSDVLSVEPHPQKPGIAIVRLFENPEPFEEKRGELTIKCWEYDEYHLELLYYDNIEADIKANFDNMINQAKIEEEQKSLTVEKLKAENDELKSQLAESKNIVTNLQVALCNFYENSL